MVKLNIKHACFISYPHGQTRLEYLFLRALKQALEGYLSPYNLGIECEIVYYDEERLKPGYRYNEALAQAICESACMVVIFSEKYESREYCLREFMAMEQIEEKRRQLAGAMYDRKMGMIVPLFIGGDELELPSKIRDNIHYCDLRPFFLLNSWRRIKFQEFIKVVAEEIKDHYKNLQQLYSQQFNSEGSIINCNSYNLPDGDSAKKSWGKRSMTPPGFPGKE